MLMFTTKKYIVAMIALCIVASQAEGQHHSELTAAHIEENHKPAKSPEVFNFKHIELSEETIDLKAPFDSSELDGLPYIEKDLSSLAKINIALDQENSNQLSGFYSSGILSLNNQVIEDVQNYITLERTPLSDDQSFYIEVNCFHFKDGVAVAKTKVEYYNELGLLAEKTTTYTAEIAKEVLAKTNLSFEVFPTLAEQNVTIKGIEQPAKITVISIEGKVLMSYKVSRAKSKTIDINNLHSGHYLIRITDLKSMQTEVHKFVKL